MLIKSAFDDMESTSSTPAVPTNTTACVIAEEDNAGVRPSLDLPPGYSTIPHASSSAARAVHAAVAAATAGDVKGAYGHCDEYSLQTTAADDGVDGDAFVSAGPSSRRGPISSVGNASVTVPVTNGSIAGIDLPPVRVPYHASFSIDQTGNITTHDRHLNHDPEALCRFLLMHLKNPADLYIKLQGSHTEVSTETVVHRDNHGHTRHETKERRETIVDFSFHVKVESMNPLVDRAVKVYVVDDDDVVHRGGVLRQRQVTLPPSSAEVQDSMEEEPEEPQNDDLEQGRQTLLPQSSSVPSSLAPCEVRVRARRRQRKLADQLAVEQAKYGFPPFLPSSLFTPTSSLYDVGDYDADPADLALPLTPSESGNGDGNGDQSRTQKVPEMLHGLWLDRRLHSRQDEANVVVAIEKWCDEYCANTKPAKRFIARRAVFGWNMERLEHELNSMVRQTGYTGRVDISFTTTASTITVFADTPLSRVLTLHWSLKVLLSLVLVYPVVWLLARFWLGPRWDGVRSALPLTRYKRVSTINMAPSRLHTPPPVSAASSQNVGALASQSCQSSSHGVVVGGVAAPPTPPPPATVVDVPRTRERFVREGLTEMEWLKEWQGQLMSAVTRRARGMVDLTLEACNCTLPFQGQPHQLPVLEDSSNPTWWQDYHHRV